MLIVDSHCHLDLLEKQAIKAEDAVASAKEAGVEYIQTICTSLDNFPTITRLTERFNNVYGSIGVHPSEVKDIVKAEKIIELSQTDKIIGIGETGLDYYYNKEPDQLSMQRESFKQHIIASQQTKLPLIIHTRDAEDDTRDIIKQMKKQQDFPALIHCFTASKQFAEDMLDIGLFISISGIVTFKNAKDLQEVAKMLPLNRLLIETDAPYLAPVPHRGKTNMPAYTRNVAEFIAEIKGISTEEVAKQTTSNFFKLFGKANFNSST